MRIDYTKEGMKITHQSGVVQLLTISDMLILRDFFNTRISQMNTIIARIDADIAEVQKIVDNG